MPVGARTHARTHNSRLIFARNTKKLFILPAKMQRKVFQFRFFLHLCKQMREDCHKQQLVLFKTNIIFQMKAAPNQPPSQLILTRKIEKKPEASCRIGSKRSKRYLANESHFLILVLHVLCRLKLKPLLPIIIFLQKAFS